MTPPNIELSNTSLANPGSDAAVGHDLPGPGNGAGRHSPGVMRHGYFELAGEGLCIGRDGGATVTDDYPGGRPYRFTGGTIKRVAIDVSGQPYLDLERQTAAMLNRE